MNSSKHSKHIAQRAGSSGWLIIGLSALLTFGATEVMGQTSLDGQTFVITSIPNGDRNLTMEDTLIFRDRKFSSAVHQALGFEAGPYEASGHGEHMHFECVTGSLEGGRITWRGELSAGWIKGTAVWEKEGGGNVEYAYSGKSITSK